MNGSPQTRVISLSRCLVIALAAMVVCESAAAATVWRLTIPVSGTWNVPSGEIYTPVFEAATFADATATVNFTEVTYTDYITSGRNYDAAALFDVAPGLDKFTYACVAGAFQIGRDTGGYPDLMTFYSRKNYETGVFEISTPGIGTVEFNARNPLNFGASKALYVRCWFNRGDGNPGPAISDIRIITDVSCVTLPGARAISAGTLGNAMKVNWRVSPADAAVAQKLYRAEAVEGPWSLLQSFTDNTTAQYMDATVSPNVTYYYKVVAEDSVTTPGAESNVVSGLFIPGPQINAVSPDTANVNSVVGLTLSGDNFPVWSGTVQARSTVSFDGVNDSYHVPSSNLINSANFTIEAWVKEGFQIIKRNGSPYVWEQFFLSVNNGGPPRFWIAQNSNRYPLDSTTPIGHGWTHLAATYDGSTQRIYINGVLDTQNTVNLTVQPWTEYISLYAEPFWDGTHCQGSMSEFRFWKVARTQAQIASSMNVALTGGDPDLVCRYDFSNGGPQLVDTTGNGHTGSPLGSPTFGLDPTGPVLVRISNGAVSRTSSGALTSTSNTLNCTIDLTGLPIGQYDVELLENGIVTASLPLGFSIVTTPIASSQSVATLPGVPKAITLSATNPNNGTLAWTIVDSPAHGTLSGTAPNLTYTPGGTYTTSDTFTFQVNDGTMDSNVATVTIAVPTTVTALSVAPGSVLASPPASIVATFSQNIDPASVNSDTVRLVRAGLDGVFDTSDDVTVAPASIAVNANTITLNLGSVQLPNDQYRILLSSGTASSPTTGLLAYWNCNENQGSALGDGSGNSYDGVLFGNAAWGPGVFGSALKFDDTDGYVKVSYPPAGDLGTGNFSVACWIKTTDSGFQVIGNRHSQYHAPFWTVRVSSVGKVDLEIDQDTNGTNYNNAVGAISINDNTWHHIVVSRTGATLYVYIDGTLDVTTTGPGTANVTNGGEVLIGDNPFVGLNAGEKFSGLLDDLRIYNRLLNALEIQALSGANQPGISDTNGNPLDGEPNAGFPSGNGTPGGDFTATFTVNSPPLQVTALSVAPGSVLAAPPASISATFSADIDPSSVTSGSFSLVGHGVDGTFDTADDVAITPAAVGVNGNTATLDLTGVQVPPDVYRIALRSDSGPSASGLAAYWRFDESTGSVVTDSSSSGITGQISGGVSRIVGVEHGGLDFNGSTGMITFGDVLNNLNLPATFSAWVYRRGTVAVTIFSTDDANNYYGFWMHIWDDNTLEISYGDGGGSLSNYRRSKRSTAAIVSQTWTHVCAVVRGPADMSLYIDGVDAGGAYSGSGNAIVHSADSFVLGHKTLGNTFIDAKLDEVRVYNRALSIQEVQNLRLATPMTDLYGNPLDGEPNATFPSGNSIPGGDFTATFRVDAPPVAYNLDFTIHAGTSGPATLNGSDPENDPISLTVVTPPAHGALSGTAPFLTYTPNAGFVGSDSFTFKANDGYRDSSLATISYAIANIAPLAVSQSLTTHFNRPAPITLSGSDADNDPLAFSIVTQPASGVLTGTPPDVIYTAYNGFVGSDSFSFKVNDGFADSATVTISISVTNAGPGVAIAASPTSAEPNELVTFNASGSDADGDALAYAWDFGDGAVSAEQNPAHAYAQVGTYTATVTVSDPAGASATASILIQVSKAPAVRLNTDEVVGFGGLPLLFDASHSTDPENQIASYDWDFGDGTPHGSGQIISKIYEQPGTYTVTLIITDAAGVSSSLTRVIEVLSGDQIGLFNGFMRYKVAWNRRAKNRDTLTFEASVNVGDAVVGAGTKLALEIVGQRFTGTLDKRQRDYSNPRVKWQARAQIRHQPSGTVALRVRIRQANLGLNFNQAGATAGGDNRAAAGIPVHLEIGAHSFELQLPSNFMFSSDGTRAKGSGASE